MPRQSKTATADGFSELSCLYGIAEEIKYAGSDICPHDQGLRDL
jgi:hypothetical protein